MKKLASMLLAGTLALSLAACGSSSSSNTSTTAAAADTAADTAAETTAESEAASAEADAGSALDQDYEFNLVGGVITGSFYQWALPVTETVSNHQEHVLMNIVPTTGTTENLAFMESGEAEFGGVDTPTLWAYINGKMAFEGNPHDDVSLLCLGYGDYYTILLPGNAEANDYEYLRGKTLNIAPTTSGINSISRNMIRILGLGDPITDFCSITELSHAEAKDAMAEGSIDAMAIQVALGNSTIMEIANSNLGLKIVNLSEEEAQAIESGWPGYVEKTIPAGSYPGVDEDTRVVGSYYGIAVRNDVPEDVVYEIVKTIFENNEELLAATPSAAETLAETTVEASGAGEIIPLHPGVVKYMKEVGLMN